MEIARIAIALNIFSLIITVILVLITGWYAYSTHKMFKAMREQKEILLKSAQVSAWAALTNAAGHPTGQNPFSRLRILAQQLESLADLKEV